MQWSKLSSDGVIAIEQSYDVSTNVFSPVDQRKKAPPVIALEPRTLELVRWHRRYPTRRNHPGLKIGLVFPSEQAPSRWATTQLNDVWRELSIASSSQPGRELPGLITGAISQPERVSNPAWITGTMSQPGRVSYPHWRRCPSRDA